jgi:hypothetical protein
MPVKEVGRYVMTDTGRDPGPAYTARLGVSGDFAVYAHPSGMGLLGYLALGANADSGAGPNYVHAATPANDVPYFTAWRMVGNVIFEKYVDCKVSTFRAEGSAGSPLIITLSVEGISSTFEASEPVLAAITDNGLLFMEGAGRFELNNVTVRLNRFTLEVNNNASGYQADDYTSEEVDVGAREVSLSFALRFTGPTAAPSYRKFFYGSDAGTTLSPALFTDAFEADFQRNANLGWKVDAPQVSYAAIPVNPDPGGDPIEVEVSTTVEKPSASPIITLTTKDQAATVTT